MRTESASHMFLRIRPINGRLYLYAEERWREDGKVRSRSRCLGPVGGRAANWAAREQYHDVLRQNVPASLGTKKGNLNATLRGKTEGAVEAALATRELFVSIHHGS